MADVKWVKVSTGLPADKKIMHIRTLPKGDTLALLWVFLICQAGDSNDNGFVCIADNVPYTPEDLANRFGIPVATVNKGLEEFEKLKMIEIIDGAIAISNWEKYQSLEKLEIIREQNRNRKRSQRERDSHANVT